MCGRLTSGENAGTLPVCRRARWHAPRVPITPAAYPVYRCWLQISSRGRGQAKHRAMPPSLNMPLIDMAAARLQLYRQVGAEEVFTRPGGHRHCESAGTLSRIAAEHPAGSLLKHLGGRGGVQQMTTSTARQLLGHAAGWCRAFREADHRQVGAAAGTAGPARARPRADRLGRACAAGAFRPASCYPGRILAGIKVQHGL